LRFGVCFSIAIIGACPNENFVSRDLAISDYSDRLLGHVLINACGPDVCFLRHKADTTVAASSYGRQVGEPLTQRSLT
jgi:hypothetical protein